MISTSPCEIARSYIGTPFHHQARVPGVGLDCVGLVICVGRELGVFDPIFDVPGYSRYPDGVMLMRNLQMHLTQIEETDMAPGDIVCVAFEKFPQHVGIVGDYLYGGLSIIHAASKHGKVIETRLLFGSSMRFVAAFRFKDK